MGVVRNTAIRLFSRAFVAGLLGWLLFRFCCLFPVTGERQLLLLVMLAGAAGGGVGGCVNWNVVRVLPRALFGLLAALVLYCCVRGSLIRAAARPDVLWVSGLLSLLSLTSFFAGSLDPRRPANRIAARVMFVLLVGFCARGVIYVFHLCGTP